MQVTGLFGVKKEQTQKFTADGRRVPITIIAMEPNTVVQVKNAPKDGYYALQLAFGNPRSHANKPLLGHFAKAGKDEKVSRFLEELRLEGKKETEAIGLQSGQKITVADVFKEGDLIKVTGVSKGKGFAGVVKRHHFQGGPKTHGQSDRWRAPGSVGSTTTPGRVLKGKRMAGHMGNSNVTIKGLRVFAVDKDRNLLLIKGLVPGFKGQKLKVEKQAR